MTSSQIPLVIENRVKLDLENIGIEEAKERWNQILGGIFSCVLKSPEGWQWLRVNEKGQVSSYKNREVLVWTSKEERLLSENGERVV